MSRRPVTWQIFSYNGTSAKPKPNIATATTASLPNIRRLSPVVSGVGAIPLAHLRLHRCLPIDRSR